MLVRGQRALAGGLGFFESLIWLIAAADVLANLDSPWKFLGYAGGYAAGTMLGTTIEKWMAIGSILLRVIEGTDKTGTVNALRNAGFYATVMNARGRDGEVQIIFSVIPRRRQNAALKIVRTENPKAYVTFEQTQRATAVSAATPPMSLRK